MTEALNAPRSFRILLAAVGSRGDVQPMLALAQTLAARGHQVRIAAPPDFEYWVANLGFAFSPVGGDVQAYMRQNQQAMTGNTFKMLRESLRYFKSETPVQARDLLNASANSEVLVYAGLAAITAPSVAERLGIPAIGVQYTTAFIPSSDYPPPTIAKRNLPRWVNSLIWRVDRMFGKWFLLGTLNEVRAEHFLPPVADFWTQLLFTYPLVIAADEALFSSASSAPQKHPYANFLFFKDTTFLDSELEDWLNAGPPPVYVGFGSMSGQGTNHVEALIIEAIQATGHRCLVSAGWAGLGAGTLPLDWRVIREAPHDKLFPRMAVVVHHGGSGTVAQVLRAGVPQVVLPLLLDQFHHAHLLHMAGLAPRPVPMEKVTAAELSAAIQESMSLPAEAREVVAMRLRESDGCTDLAIRLETIIGTS
jgi:UDP:flavonoid glycosyltransferase YjiC (YdhE family)